MNKKSESYNRAILDALPFAIFVVDEDARVEAVNRAAAAAFGLIATEVRGARAGEALHCLHEHDAPQGCGRGPECKTCVVRQTLGEALTQGCVRRRRARFDRVAGEKTERLEIRVTASPMPEEQGKALLIIEDLSEMAKLQDLVPICARCKGIRHDQDYWQKIESFIQEQIGVDFTHGLCPTCIGVLYPDMKH